MLTSCITLYHPIIPLFSLEVISSIIYFSFKLNKMTNINGEILYYPDLPAVKFGVRIVQFVISE